MLSLEKVKSELQKYAYPYNGNILCGHTKQKIKWVLPLGALNVLAFEQAASFLFGFDENGIDLFPVSGDWDIADNLFIPWNDMSVFQMKNGLLENEMVIQTPTMKIVMKINKMVVGNPWVKENLNALKAKGYYYRRKEESAGEGEKVKLRDDEKVRLQENGRQGAFQPERKISPDGSPEENYLEIARIITENDAEVLAEMRESFMDSRGYAVRHSARLLEEYGMDEDELRNAAADHWWLMTDILELHGYVCTRDWKDELQDFLYFLFQTKRAVSEGLSMTGLETEFSENDSIPVWSRLLGERLSGRRLVVGNIDTDSDSYTVFFCTEEEMELLKKTASETGHTITCAQDA